MANNPVTVINVLDFYRRMAFENYFGMYNIDCYEESALEVEEITTGKKSIVHDFFDGQTRVDSLDEYVKLSAKNESNIILIQIEELIANGDTEEKQKLILRQLLSNIDYYILNLNHLIFLQNDLNNLKNKLSTKFNYLIDNGKWVSNITSANPKIQWLGKTNVLATLIYHLWQGQDKGKNKFSTTPMLKAQKKDLEELLLNNFLDKDGKPLKASTISDYLNASKPKSRAKEGTRIELDY